MADPLIDRATFEELQETAGKEFVVELVDTFLVEAPQMLESLRDALANRNADQFRRAAHSLKSNCNTFGAVTLGTMARELELSGLTPVEERHGQPLEDLTHEYVRVAAALKELCSA